MRLSVRRLLPVVVLILWTAPGVAAFGIGLHLADHHHHHGHGHHDHGPAGAELLQVAMHGHHHGVGDAPDHRHDAAPAVVASFLRPAPSVVAAPPLTSTAPAPLAVRSRRDRARATGPPAPLFRSHCALLL